MSEQQTKAQADKPEFTPPATQADLDRIIAERLNRERAKYADYQDLRKKAEQFDQLQESQKTELEKAIARAEKAERDAAEYKQSIQVTDWKQQVAKEHGVPVEALRGATLEQLTEHAEQLKALMTPDNRRTVIINEGEPKSLPLNGTGIEDALARALGIS